MDIKELKQELLDKKTRQLYIFIGDELALQDIYIDKIKEISGLPSLRVNTLSSIFSRITTKGLIKSKPNIYIIRNDEEYLKAESSWDKIIETDYKGNIIILLYTDINETCKFSKKHIDYLTTFDFIGEDLLKARLQATTGMPEPYCKDIVKMCGCNYGRIKNELYKLGVYGRLNNLGWNASYLQAKKNNMIHEEIGDIIFEFTGAVESRNIKKAYELWPKMKYTGDGPMRVLSVLYNSFRQILMVQSTPQDMRTEQVLGLSSKQIYVTSFKCDKYNLFELVNIVKTIRYLEKGIKIGTVSEEFAMEYLLGQIW